MPYIKIEKRIELSNGRPPETPGELNYTICNLINEYLKEKDLTYDILNAIIGVLECVKLEVSRRILFNYEDKKLLENRDVFPRRLTNGA